MPRAVPLIQAFNAGELSENMAARTDQDKYRGGCKVLLNAIPVAQGPARNRAGSRYVASTKSNSKAWLRKFEYSARQSYVLEFGDTYLRFFTNRGQLLSAGSPYEIVSAFNAASLVAPDQSGALRSAQLNDIMWLCSANGTVAPQKLKRLGATNWTMTPVDFQWGPFVSVDPLNTIKVSASAATGSVTLYASAAVWDARDINNYFYMEIVDPGATTVWQAGVTFALGTIVRNNGNFYKAVSFSGIFGTTASVPPTHLVGVVTDGSTSIGWQYVHSGFGIVKIATVTGDGLSATGTVVEAANYGNAAAGVTPELPKAMINAGSVGTVATGSGSNSTTRWGRSLFNSVDGYPTDVKVYRNRVWYTRDLWHAFSVEGGYDDFSLKTNGAFPTAQSAIVIRTGIDKLDAARWIMASKRALVGGSLLEASIGEQTGNQVFSSTNVKADPETRYGGQFTQPVAVGNAVLFFQRGGKRLREMIVDDTGQNFKADDLTALADHILRERAVDADYAQEPNTQLGCVRRDGIMSTLTYNRERNVVGWARFQMGGVSASGAYGAIESTACVASPDGDRDDRWLIVNRTINGQTVRFVEWIEDELKIETDVKAAFYCDAGLTYSGAATQTIGGLTHLVGQTVAVRADGATHPQKVVAADGTISLDWPASIVHVGLPYRTIVAPMRLDVSMPDGTAQTRIKSFGDIFLRLKDTIGGKLGPSLDRLDPIIVPGLRSDAALSDTPVPFTGDVMVTAPVNTDTDGWIYLVQDDPQPFTVVGIVPRVEIND